VRLVSLAFSSGWARYPIAVAIIAIVVGIRAYVFRAGASRTRILLFYPPSCLPAGSAASGGGAGHHPGCPLAGVLWLPPLYSLRIQRVRTPAPCWCSWHRVRDQLLNEARLQAERRAKAAEEEMRRGEERLAGDRADGGVRRARGRSAYT